MKSPKNLFHKVRLDQKMTQAQFAESLGVSQPTVNAIENNSNNPSFGVLYKLRNVFNVDMNEFIMTPGVLDDRHNQNIVD